MPSLPPLPKAKGDARQVSPAAAFDARFQAIGMIAVLSAPLLAWGYTRTVWRATERRGLPGVSARVLAVVWTLAMLAVPYLPVLHPTFLALPTALAALSWSALALHLRSLSREGSAERKSVARLWLRGLPVVLLYTIFIVLLTQSIDEIGLPQFSTAYALALLQRSIPAVVLAFVTHWLIRLTKRTFTRFSGPWDTARCVQLVQRLKEVEGLEARLVESGVEAEGTLGTLATRVRLDATRAPARLDIAVEIPGLDHTHPDLVLTGGTGGIGLGDPILDAHLRVEGVDRAEAKALTDGLRGELMAVFHRWPHSRIEKGQLVLTGMPVVPIQADGTVAVESERFLGAAGLAREALDTALALAKQVQSRVQEGVTQHTAAHSARSLGTTSRAKALVNG